MGTGAHSAITRDRRSGRFLAAGVHRRLAKTVRPGDRLATRRGGSRKEAVRLDLSAARDRRGVLRASSSIAVGLRRGSSRSGAPASGSCPPAHRCLRRREDGRVGGGRRRKHAEPLRRDGSIHGRECGGPHRGARLVRTALKSSSRFHVEFGSMQLPGIAERTPAGVL